MNKKRSLFEIGLELIGLELQQSNELFERLTRRRRCFGNDSSSCPTMCDRLRVSRPTPAPSHVSPTMATAKRAAPPAPRKTQHSTRHARREEANRNCMTYGGAGTMLLPRPARAAKKSLSQLFLLRHSRLAPPSAVQQPSPPRPPASCEVSSISRTLCIGKSRKDPRDQKTQEIRNETQVRLTQAEGHPLVV